MERLQRSFRRGRGGDAGVTEAAARLGRGHAALMAALVLGDPVWVLAPLLGLAIARIGIAVAAGLNAPPGEPDVDEEARESPPVTGSPAESRWAAGEMEPQPGTASPDPSASAATSRGRGATTRGPEGAVPRLEGSLPAQGRREHAVAAGTAFTCERCAAVVVALVPGRGATMAHCGVPMRRLDGWPGASRN